MFLLWVLSGSSNVANAALVNYRINASGNVLAFDNGVNYYNAFFNGSTGAYWAFDTNSNTYGTSTTGFNSTLQTNDFTVSDILDVTWTLNDQAWVKTTQGNYRIDAYGNVTALGNGINYYNAFFNGSWSSYWAFDTNSNTYGTSTTGFNRTLQTNDFTVSDILDVTWTLNDQAWVSTTQGNYRIDAYGNVTTMDNGVNYFNAFFNGNSSAYWAFDTNTNTYGTSTTGFNRSLLTNAFSASDIVNVTWTINDQAWVQVRTSEVPISGSGLILLLGVAVSLFARQRNLLV